MISSECGQFDVSKTAAVYCVIARSSRNTLPSSDGRQMAGVMVGRQVWIVSTGYCRPDTVTSCFTKAIIGIQWEAWLTTFQSSRGVAVHCFGARL